MVLRLGLALLVGAIVGFEREIKDKPAGLRTHMLVCLGSAIFALIPFELGLVEESVDALSRVLQGIITGIGFIGGGVILQRQKRISQEVQVHGLTSAAAIWISCALGIAVGCGLWKLGLIGALFALLTLNLVKKLENL